MPRPRWNPTVRDRLDSAELDRLARLADSGTVVAPVCASPWWPGPHGVNGGGWEYGITNDWPRTVVATRCLVRLLGAPEPRFRFMD